MQEKEQVQEQIRRRRGGVVVSSSVSFGTTSTSSTISVPVLLLSYIYLLLSVLTVLLPVVSGQIISDDVYNYPYSLSRVKFYSNNAKVEIITSYPIVTSTFGNVMFLPARVMLPPKSWSTLCGYDIPELTKIEMNRYRARTSSFDPVYLLITETDDTSTSANNGGCSTMDMINNVARLNAYLSDYVSIISMIIIPDTLHTTMTDDYYYDFNVAFVSSNVSKIMKKSIIDLASTTKTIPQIFGTQGPFALSYCLALTEDYNDDGMISIADYDLFYHNDGGGGGTPSPPIPSATPPYTTKSSNNPGAPVGFIILGVFVGGFVILLFCWVLFHNKNNNNNSSAAAVVYRESQREQQHYTNYDNNSIIQQQQQQHQNDEYQEQEEESWMPGPIYTRNAYMATMIRNNNMTTNDEVNQRTLSEADFASLPQMIYHSKKFIKSSCTTNGTGTAEDDDNDVDVCIKSIGPTKSPSTSTLQQQDKDKENEIDVEQGSEQESVSVSESSTKDVGVVDNDVDYYNNVCKVIIHDDVPEEKYCCHHNNDCCSICLDEFIDDEIVTVLPRCSHLFHTQCIGQWIVEQHSNNCPLCKTLVMAKQL